MGLSLQGGCDRRQWLADVLCGRPFRAAPFCDNSAAVAAARDEGVLALVAERLRALPESNLFCDAFTQAARPVIVTSMLREADTRRVLELLAAAKIRTLLLKGSSLSYWLYPAPYLRESGDIDLLFGSSADVEAALLILNQNGFEGGFYVGEHAHEVGCKRKLSPSCHIDVDLHWRMFNEPVFANVFSFDELWMDSISISNLGEGARGLSSVHAFVHASIHRVNNLRSQLGDRLKWLYDIHLLAKLFTPLDWDHLVQISRQRGMGQVCLDALDAARDVFGCVAPETATSALGFKTDLWSFDVRHMHSWRYVQRENLRALPTIRARLHWLWARLLPPIDYMREFYGAEITMAGLLLERFRRLLYGLRRFKSGD